MTSLGIRYLTGHAVATTVTREKAEWPPHPGRVFMAMAAAYFETGGDERERKALEWLERQEYPRVSAGECHARTLVGVYVPVNDRATDIPPQKQERNFPTVSLENDTVFLIWTSDAPQEIRDALDTLCQKVTRIGHSSSLTQVWLESSPKLETADWIPCDEPLTKTSKAERMRVATSGTLAYLEREFEATARSKYAEATEALAGATGKEKTRLKAQIALQFPQGEPTPRRPQLPKWAGYIRNADAKGTAEPAATGIFSAKSLIVLAQEQGDRIGLESTLKLTNALRNAAMKAAGDTVPEWLSGHSADGKPTKLPHVAFFPLPFVDDEYADGHVLGLALAVPRGIEARADFRRVIGNLLFRHTEDKPICLWQSSYKDAARPIAWHCHLKRSSPEDRRLALNVERWTRASQLWASVTPVVLHHYPKKNRDGDVAEIVREAFVTAGLPKPEKIQVQASSFFQGAGHVRDMPPFTEGGEALCRYQTHIIVQFDQPVEGPMLVGRGRFRGYGLCMPVRSEENGQPETE